jgi:hypothetical protein
MRLAYLLGTVLLSLVCALCLCNVFIIGGFVGSLCNKDDNKPCAKGSKERERVAYWIKANVGAAIGSGLGLIALVMLLQRGSGRYFRGPPSPPYYPQDAALDAEIARLTGEPPSPSP